MLIGGIKSHATSEVKTSRGWLGVDSNHPFLLITQDNIPVKYSAYKAHFSELAYRMVPEEFYKDDLFVIYGLYSRHGKFHGPDLPSPEFNLNELWFNLD